MDSGFGEFSAQGLRVGAGALGCIFVLEADTKHVASAASGMLRGPLLRSTSRCLLQRVKNLLGQHDHCITCGIRALRVRKKRN